MVWRARLPRVALFGKWDGFLATLFVYYAGSTLVLEKVNQSTT